MLSVAINMNEEVSEGWLGYKWFCLLNSLSQCRPENLKKYINFVRANNET